MRSVNGSLKSSVLISKGIKLELESSPKPRKIHSSNQSIKFATKDLEDPAFKPSEPLFDTQFDWIENEMAKVCGEGRNNQEEVSKFPTLTSSCSSEELKCSLPFDECKKSETVVVNSFNLPVQPGKIDWKSLRKKHEAEMKRKLEKLVEEGGLQKRARLERRFSELFGSDELAVDAMNGKKDEIASFTVKHLMPFYKKQRIASKDLFKKLAKHLSQSLIDKKSFSDEKDAQAQVEEFFRGGKLVTSDTDIYS